MGRRCARAAGARRAALMSAARAWERAQRHLLRVGGLAGRRDDRLASRRRRSFTRLLRRRPLVSSIVLPRDLRRIGRVVSLGLREAGEDRFALHFHRGRVERESEHDAAEDRRDHDAGDQASLRETWQQRI